MSAPEPRTRRLSDVSVHVRVKLTSLWASGMFCYVYGDYFELYVPGKLPEMLQGKIGPLVTATQGVLVGTSIMMAIPSVMVFLSLVLPAGLCRFANVALGLVYSVIMALVISGSAWQFYVLLGVVEIVLTSLVVWYAWPWPKEDAGGGPGSAG